MSTKIVILDDHPLLIKGLQTMLQHAAGIEVVGCFQKGKDLLRALKLNKPDVLILDIQLQGEMGDELALSVSKQYPDIGILVLTNMEHEYYIRAMLKHGVLGYVLKSSELAVLLEGIGKVSSGRAFFDPVIRKKVVKIENSIMEQPTLTRREKEILELIAANYNSSDIADKLFLSKRTVDNHRVHLLLKLDVKNSASLVKKAIDLGLIK